MDIYGRHGTTLGMSENITKDPEMVARFKNAIYQAEIELQDHPSKLRGNISFLGVLHKRAREIFLEKYGVEWPEPKRDPNAIYN